VIRRRDQDGIDVLAFEEAPVVAEGRHLRALALLDELIQAVLLDIARGHEDDVLVVHEGVIVLVARLPRR